MCRYVTPFIRSSKIISMGARVECSLQSAAGLQQNSANWHFTDRCSAGAIFGITAHTVATII